MNDAGSDFIRVGTLGDLRDRGHMVIGTPSGAVLIIADGDDILALDNRCPHMGFPLHRGSIQDGILTCHWHHARFDVRSGSTFDLWADDVPLRAVRIVDGEVWVAATPAPRDEAGIGNAGCMTASPTTSPGDRKGGAGSHRGRRATHGNSARRSALRGCPSRALGGGAHDPYGAG